MKKDGKIRQFISISRKEADLFVKRLAMDYGLLLKPEYFDSQPLSLIFDMAKKHVLNYDNEIDKSSLHIVISELSVQRGWESGVVETLIEESNLIFNSYISSEQFIIDQVVRFVKQKEMLHALTRSVQILENDGDYEQVLKMVDSAVSVGCGQNEGLKFDDLHTLPEQYRERYDPSKLVQTGFHSYDKALGGGLAPGELHILQSGSKKGKCLAIGTMVMMSDGSFRKVEDVLIGEYLMGPGGEAKKVTGTTSGVDQCYEVTQNKGISYTVNKDHILSIRDSRDSKIYNISAENYFNSGKKFKFNTKGYKAELEFEEKHVSVDPYYLGIWLGDGYTDCCVRVSNPDPENHLFMAEYAESLGLKTHTIEQKG